QPDSKARDDMETPWPRRPWLDLDPQCTGLEPLPPVSPITLGYGFGRVQPSQPILSRRLHIQHFVEVAPTGQGHASCQPIDESLSSRVCVHFPSPMRCFAFAILFAGLTDQENSEAYPLDLDVVAGS